MIVRLFGSVSAILVVAGMVLAQGNPLNEPSKKNVPSKKEPAKPAPGSLEDTLEKSLRNSADIKAAEAKVRETEAELNRVRQQVLTRATALHSDLNLAKRMLAVAEQSLATQEQLRRQGQAGVDGVLAAQAMVEKHRGEVEKLEAELKSLRGEFAIKAIGSVAFSPDGNLVASASADGIVRILDAADGSLLTVEPYVKSYVGTLKLPVVPGTMMDRVKKLLDQEVTLDLASPPGDALKALLEGAKSDIPVRELWGAAAPSGIVNVRGKLSVGAWIQAIEDSDPEIRVVVRDYGILLTTRDRLPEGALRVQDLWKGNYAELKRPELKGAEKK